MIGFQTLDLELGMKFFSISPKMHPRVRETAPQPQSLLSVVCLKFRSQDPGSEARCYVPGLHLSCPGCIKAVITV